MWEGSADAVRVGGTRGREGGEWEAATALGPAAGPAAGTGMAGARQAGVQGACVPLQTHLVVQDSGVAHAQARDEGIAQEAALQLPRRRRLAPLLLLLARVLGGCGARRGRGQAGGRARGEVEARGARERPEHMHMQAARHAAHKVPNKGGSPISEASSYSTSAARSQARSLLTRMMDSSLPEPAPDGEDGEQRAVKSAAGTARRGGARLGRAGRRAGEPAGRRREAASARPPSARAHPRGGRAGA